MGKRTDQEAIALAKPWVKELLRRVGIHVETFRDGTMGLVNVPAKYCAAIDGLHKALVAVLAGDDLPEFEPLPPTKAKVRHGKFPSAAGKDSL